MFFSKSVLLFFIVVVQYCYGRSLETRKKSASLNHEICIYSNEEWELFMKGRYFSSGYGYRVFNQEARTYSTYYMHILNNYNDCLGITLDNNETVVLECPGKPPREPGCFDVFNTNPKSTNSTESSTKKGQKVCLEEGKRLTTPNKLTIDLFQCIEALLINIPDITPRRV